MKSKFFKKCGWVAIGLLLWPACTKNDDSTIVPIGTEYYIEDILSVVDDAAFLSDFGSYAEGYIPPKIVGSYVMNPKERIGSNVSGWILNVVEPDVNLRFTEQHNGIMKMDMVESTETVTDRVYVMGNGNDFTVYFIENKSYDLPGNGPTVHVDLKRGVVMAGTVSDAGLSNFRMATIIMEESPNGVSWPAGSYFIYKDGDALAERKEW